MMIARSLSKDEPKVHIKKKMQLLTFASRYNIQQKIVTRTQITLRILYFSFFYFLYLEYMKQDKRKFIANTNTK